MATTLIETIDADPTYILAGCGENEVFRNGDYVWIVDRECRWVAQLTQPPVPIHRSNKDPISPAMLHQSEMLGQNPDLLPGEMILIMKTRIEGEIIDDELTAIETRWRAGAKVSLMNAEALVKYLRIPAYQELSGSCGSNVIGINLNAGRTPLCLSPELFDSHIMISGATNCGKSNVIMNIANLALAYDDCVFVYDSKPDFRLIAEPNSDMAVANIWKDFRAYKKLPHGIGEIYSIGFYGKCDPKRIQKVVGLWASTLEPDELASLFFPYKDDRNQFEAFSAAAAWLYQERVATGLQEHFTVADVVTQIRKGKYGAKSTLDSIEYKVGRRRGRLPWLDAIGQSIAPNAFDGGSRYVEELDFAAMIKCKRLVHVSLEKITSPADHAMLVAYFLRKGFEYCQGDDAIGITQIIDEASRIFDNRSEFAKALNAAFNTAVREGRSRNHAMVLSLQNATHLPSDVIQNLNTHIVLLQNSYEEAESATQAMGKEYASLAKQIGRGTAYVKLMDSKAILKVKMAPSPCELERRDNKQKLNHGSKFMTLIRNSKRISYNDFLGHPHEVTDPIIAGLTSDVAKELGLKAREYIEANTANLYNFDFGNQVLASELLSGRGNRWRDLFGNAINLDRANHDLRCRECSYRRPTNEKACLWSSIGELNHIKDSAELMKQLNEILHAFPETAPLRYYELVHAIEEISEPYLFFDGPIIYEWLAGQDEAAPRYEELFRRRKVIGVIKDLHRTKRLEALGHALRPGELFVYRNLGDYFKGRHWNPTESFKNRIAPNVLRGVFRPARKPFGFECHQEHLADMIRILAADCQMTHPGHEIPFLLNHVDLQVRSMFPNGLVRHRIEGEMLKLGIELYYESTDEFDFR